MLAAPTALATSIRPSSTTTFPSNYSDVSSAIAPISYDLNSAIRYDVNSAANREWRARAVEACTMPAPSWGSGEDGTGAPRWPWAGAAGWAPG
jgi:hypothetical protein